MEIVKDSIANRLALGGFPSCSLPDLPDSCAAKQPIGFQAGSNFYYPQWQLPVEWW